MSAKLMNYLRNDEELQQLRKQWKKVFPTKGFPPFNFDCYSCPNDYKQQIKEAIETGDESKSGGVIKLVDLEHQK